MVQFRKPLAAFALGLSMGLAPLAAAHAQPSASERLLVPARAAYYSLSRLGFAGAECRIVPNWELVLGPRTAANKTGYDVLDQLEFRLKVGAGGDAHVTSRDPGGPRTGNLQTGVQQIFSGLEQAVNGLFATWSLFMVNSPLPGAQTPVTMTTQAGGYRLAYKDDGSDVVEDVDSQGVISKIDVRNAGFASTIEPSFAHPAQGMTLSRYVGDYRPTSGPGVVHLDVRLTYQTANGLIFPSQADVDTTYDGAPTKLQLAFTDCQLAKK